MPRYSSIFIILLQVAAIDPAGAQDKVACESPAARALAEESLLQRFGVGDPDVIELQAGELEATLSDNPTASMSGGVLLRRGDRLAGAETASYDPLLGALKLAGGVRYEDPDALILSDSAEFAYESGRIRFDGAEFEIASNNARGEARVLEINQDGRLQLLDVGYTTCPPESNDWIIEAGEIELDTRTGVGKARKVRLRFQGVPILYAPYLSFPITDARKSGILTPEIGSTDRSGNELSIPYYWNIAENYDATITPHLLTDRGLQIGTEFRYLLANSGGTVEVEYLPNDSKFNDDRHQLRFQHQTLLQNGWRNQIDIRDVSDSQYFEDLGGSIGISSITHLNRSVEFDFFDENWSLLGRVQDYQTIDSAIEPEDRPYRRLPQIYARGYWPDNVLGLTYSLDMELVYFDRNVGDTGWRLNAAPQIALPIEKAGWFVTPAVVLDHTRYDLDKRLAGQDENPSRTVPIASLDTGLYLERSMNSPRRVQTLEPRLLYVNVPFREQSDLPMFDTISPDLNLVQLFRKNRFLGVDRIADTDQLSIGVTSRIIDVDTGRELVSATIGQALYLSQSKVALPGEPPNVSESSDYIAEVRILLSEHLNFDVGHQWSGGDRGTAQSEARLQYRPQPNKILNFAYRFRRESLEQGDVSWSWPLSQSWNFVGRYNYSFRENEVLEQFYGLEYESCCWGLRLVSRRHISKRDGTRDSSVGLQLVLKGMTRVGTAADKLLERGILGYSPTL